MDSLTFTPGRAFLSSNSPSPPWTAVFEDEGPAGYFYACDRSQETHEHSIMDAMLIYNGSSLGARDGIHCGLYLAGSAKAMPDFAARMSFCRSNFPNFLEDDPRWRKTSHAWDDDALRRFEAEIYA